jgi:transposase-like protein
MNRQLRKHSSEFKREAVALVTEHGYSFAGAGRSPDVKAKSACAGEKPGGLSD